MKRVLISIVLLLVFVNSIYAAVPSCLDRPNIEVLSGTYTDRVIISSPPVSLAVDARTGISLTTGTRALEIGKSSPSEDLCVVGWTVIGQQPLNLTWRVMHDDITGSALRVEGSNYVTDGLRTHNVEDGFDPRSGENFSMRNAWMTYIRDDCIENDEFSSGQVIDSLFDGCYTFFSEQDVGDVAGETLIFDHILAHLLPMPGPYDTTDSSIMGHGSFFKKFDKGGRHEPIIRDSIFFLEDDCYNGCKDWPPGTVATNVTVVWVGEGDFPMSVLPGMTLTTDRSVWDDAVTIWKSRHGCTTMDQPCTKLHNPDPYTDTFPIYQCTGSIPGNASAWDSEESTNLIADTLWNYSETDTPIKCQYTCNASYTWSGSACVAQTVNLCDNLEALYHFDEDSTTITDYSGNDNYGTAENSAAFYPQGKFNSGFDLSPNSNSLIRISDSDSIDLTGSFSVSAWVYHRSASTWQPIFARESSQYNEEYALFIRPSEANLGFTVDNVGNCETTSNPLNANQWNHVVAVFDDDNDFKSIWVNGVREAYQTGFTNSPTSTTQDLCIGDICNDLRDNGQFAIDEMAIWNRTLSDSEILGLYNSGAPITCGAVSACGDADGDGNGSISITELIDYIGRWKAGEVNITQLIDAIGKWKGGC